MDVVGQRGQARGKLARVGAPIADVPKPAGVNVDTSPSPAWRSESTMRRATASLTAIAVAPGVVRQQRQIRRRRRAKVGLDPTPQAVRPVVHVAGITADEDGRRLERLARRQAGAIRGVLRVALAQSEDGLDGAEPAGFRRAWPAEIIRTNPENSMPAYQPRRPSTSWRLNQGIGPPLGVDTRELRKPGTIRWRCVPTSDGRLPPRSTHQCSSVWPEGLGTENASVGCSGKRIVSFPRFEMRIVCSTGPGPG